MADYQGIYNRLNGASQYTPLSAETFGDWSMEAGDVITVTKDGQSYASPVMIAGTDWRGAGKVTVESTGNRKREPLSVLSRKKFSGGGGGYWNSRKAFTKIAQSDTEINLIATEQRTIGGKVTTLESNFSVMSDRIGGSISADGKIIAEAAIEAITDSNGNLSSRVYVKADRIDLDGLVTAFNAASKNLSVQSLLVGSPTHGGTGAITCHGSININGSLHHVGTDENFQVLNITKDNNELTITKTDGMTITFSKAVSLTGEWSGTVAAGKSYKVTPSVGSPHYSPQIDSIYRYAAVVWDADNKGFSVKLRAQDENGEDLIEETIDFDTTASYNAGANAGSITMPSNYIYTTSGNAPSGSVNATTLKTRIQQAIADGDKVVFRIDCGSHTPQYFYCQF